MTDTQLRVLIVDQNLARASILEEGLREAGFVEGRNVALRYGVPRSG